jgi:hypothetical protein
VKPRDADPASDYSLSVGCTCPVSANGTERDDGEPFFVHDGCPLHGWVQDKRFSQRVRYRFGGWWIDEVSSPAVVFVCNVFNDYYWAMENCDTDKQLREAAGHIRRKTWCQKQYGATPPEDVTPISSRVAGARMVRMSDVIARQFIDYPTPDLDHALRFGRELQALKSSKKKTPRWGDYSARVVASVIDRLETGTAACPDDEADACLTAAHILRSIYAKRDKDVVVMVGTVRGTVSKGRSRSPKP